MDDERRLLRRIALYDYWTNNPKDNQNQPHDFRRRFTSNSGWMPATHQISDFTVKTMNLISETSSNLIAGKLHTKNNIQYIKQSCKQNITKTQIKTIKNFKRNTELIVKPADKGGAVVVMDKALYEKEALRQLNNNHYYRPLPDGPIYQDTASAMFNILLELFTQGYITGNQLGYLRADPKTMDSRYMYILPKIHKSRASWPDPRMPAGRPIISDSASESVRVCEYIDYFLQPLSKLHPSYLKDTYDFIGKVRGQQIDPHWLLISADVESLYTNMRIDRILETVAEIFAEFPNPERHDRLILKLLQLILENNDFEFNGLFYLQICGIAMGRKFAPSCANIYLRDFDDKAMNNFRIQPLLYGRFLDDIFGVWPGTRADLDEYEAYLNGLVPGIKVKFTARDHIIEFLDTQVYKTKDKLGRCFLATKVYFKPTDTHQLLHKTSYHPRHTFRGIVKSQFIRFKRISTTKWDYDQACATLNSVLTKRGYTHRLLSKLRTYIWRNYDVRTSSHRLPPRFPRPPRRNLPVVTFYDKFHSRLNKEWGAHIRGNPILKTARVISAYRRHKNLRDHLVKGRYGRYLEDPDRNLDLLLQAMERREEPELEGPH